jgi:hypothetical protein
MLQGQNIFGDVSGFFDTTFENTASNAALLEASPLTRHTSFARYSCLSVRLLDVFSLIAVLSE